MFNVQVKSLNFLLHMIVMSGRMKRKKLFDRQDTFWMFDRKLELSNILIINGSDEYSIQMFNSIGLKHLQKMTVSKAEYIFSFTCIDYPSRNKLYR